MVYEKTEGRWREWLTEKEATRIAEIDATEVGLRDQLNALRFERQGIANRAIQRARYHEKKVVAASPTRKAGE